MTRKSDSNLNRVLEEDGVPFSELEKYVFYGRVCKEDISKNALDEVRAIYYKVCDTKYAEIKLELNYYPNDDPTLPPINNWRPFAFLLMANCINDLYQATPFDLTSLAKK